jgi:hypothetical protein
MAAGSSAEESEDFDDEETRTRRASEIGISEKDLLNRVARLLVNSGSSHFEFGIKRFLLTKNGQSHNQGYQIETENLDGSGRFRNSWSALSGDEDWQIECITNQLARLLAYTESELN